jgi:hypothetical protein
LIEEDFVFVCFENASYGEHRELKPIAAFQEEEGLTLVIPHFITVHIL